MKALVLSLALLALTGCTFCREHKATCAAVAWVAVTTVVLSSQHTDSSKNGVTYPIGPPLEPDCTRFPEMCK